MVKRTSARTQRESEGAGALFIPAGVLTGMGFGFAYGNVPVGLFIGLGTGFFAFVIIMLFLFARNRR